jgi:hypothetical protein
MTGSTYEFGRRTGVCALSGKAFGPGDSYIAALIEKSPEEGEGLDRADYAIDAWESSPRPERLFAFWRATLDEGGENKPTLIDDESLLGLFEQLEGATEPKRLAFRFVLALLLVRKRLLVLAGERKGVLLVQEKLTGPGSVAAQAKAPVVQVVDPGLDAAAIAEVTEQLESVIRVGA